MNFRKSVKICLAKYEKDMTWLAGELDVLPSSLSSILANNHPRGVILEKTANAFEIKVSEFVALGE